MSVGNAGAPDHLKRRWYEDPRPLIYVVVEVKCDGGDIRRNSMRAMAAMAVTDTGHKISSFTVTMSPLDGTAVDQRTMALFRDHMEAWKASTTNPQRASAGITAFASWVKSLPGQTALVASPLSQTAVWLDFYLRRFTAYGVYRGPFIIDPLFFGPGVDLATLVMGVTGRHYRETSESLLPVEWRGNRDETHKVHEDVEMHADLLISMLRLREALPRID
jgi:hypothetical protein